MKFAIATIIALVQAAAIVSENDQGAVSVDDSYINGVSLIFESSEENQNLEVIPDWLVEFKDFIDSDQLDFNFELYLQKLDDEQTDELFYLISLMIEAGKTTQ